MSKAGKTGITTNTPKNILFGAGTIHKNVGFKPLTTEPEDWDANYTKYFVKNDDPNAFDYANITGEEAPTWAANTYFSAELNLEDTIIGATSGGSKVTIQPEVTDVEVDGALVKVKDFSIKTGETASMEINFIEINKEIMRHAIIGHEIEFEHDKFDIMATKPDIEEDDYFDNIAFVGKTLDKRDIIVIMGNAICTSGFETEGKNKEAGVGKYTFESHADLESDLDRLPVYILYPKAAA